MISLSIPAQTDTAVLGCMDVQAVNFNEQATEDDGSCIYDTCDDSTEVFVYLNMMDAFGDGWNGNTVSFHAGTELIYSGNLDASAVDGNGAFAQDHFCLPADVCVEVIAGGGSYVGEISWELVTAGGEVIQTGYGASEATFFPGQSGVICGCTIPEAVNFEATAMVDDGSCLLPEICEPINGVFVQFMMYDTFGDGWNGAIYTLSNGTGETLVTGSLDDALFDVSPGNQGYDYFCLSGEECYQLEVSSGGYPTEIQWQIIDASTGEVLFERMDGNGVGQYGVSATPLICGCTDESALNFDPTATSDDGSCFAPICSGTDSTSYALHLIHESNYFWGGNVALLMDLTTGDTLLSAGNFNGEFAPDYFINNFEGYWHFCVPNDACLQFFAGDGSTNGSPAWEIVDFSGNILHSGGLGLFDVGFGSSASACLSGCTLPEAVNYDPAATVEDGSCIVCSGDQQGLIISRQFADNYWWINPSSYAILDEETGDVVLSGTFPGEYPLEEVIHCLEPGCYAFEVPWGYTYESWSLTGTDGTAYAAELMGPFDGYPLTIGIDPEDCAFEGCTDEAAVNYNPSVSVDDGTCAFAPDNDDVENAQAIGCGMSLTGTLALASGDEYNNTTILGNPISNNGAVWYEFNAQEEGQVTFSTCASADLPNGVFDTDVVVFFENPDGSLTPVATNDDSGLPGCGSGNYGSFNSIVIINAEQGQNYLIRVGTFADFSNQTEIVLGASCSTCSAGFPINDDLCDVVLPLVSGGQFEGDLCCAGPDEDFGMSGLSPFATSYGVWYTFTTDGVSDLYQIDVVATGAGAVGYAIYTGGECDDLTPLMSGVVAGTELNAMLQYFGPLASSGAVTVPIEDVNAGVEYVVYVWTTQFDGCGTYSLGFSADIVGCTDPIATNYDPEATFFSECTYDVVPPNDECEGALQLGCGESLSGNTGGATSSMEPGPCGADESGVWYALETGGGAQLVSFSTCGSETNVGFEVYQVVGAPDAVLSMASLNPGNEGGISVVVVHEGDTVATFDTAESSGSLIGYELALDGGEYTVYYTNEGAIEDSILANVLDSNGNLQWALCDGGCTTLPDACMDLTINADSYPSETYWSVIDASGNTVASGSPQWANTANTESFCLPAGSYVLEVMDIFGDGILGTDDINLVTSNGQVLIAAGDVEGMGATFQFELVTGPWAVLPGETVIQNFSIFGGTDACSSLMCWNQGNSILGLDEACANGQLLQFTTDSTVTQYMVHVFAGEAGIQGPFTLEAQCEPAIFGCMDALACNYDVNANIQDPDQPCEYISCLDCETVLWEYCYDNNENWSFTLDHTNGGGTILIDLSGTSIETGWDQLLIEDAATGVNLYDSDEGLYEVMVVAGDSVIVSFNSDNWGSCISGSDFGISMAITCAEAPVSGCDDSLACNFLDGLDLVDNTLCDYGCLGCTIESASNFEPLATVDDGSCCFGLPIEFEMFDSFGDGWNGAYYSFTSVDGSIAVSGDFLWEEGNGYLEVDELCLDSACYVLEVTAGAFPGEVSWSFIWGGQVLSGGAGIFGLDLGGDCALGCTDTSACNFDDTAELDDGFCTFPEYDWLDCAGNCLNDINGNGICDESEPVGCMDPWADNFDPEAVAPGFCNYYGFEPDNAICEGAMALSCGDTVLGSAGWIGDQPIWFQIESDSAVWVQVSLCPSDPQVSMMEAAIHADSAGCMTPGEPLAIDFGMESCFGGSVGFPLQPGQAVWLALTANWNFSLTSSLYTVQVQCAEYVIGCTNEVACNFDPQAVEDDGSCSYPVNSAVDCNGACLSDLDGDGVCDPFELSGCMDPDACNYEPEAEFLTACDYFSCLTLSVLEVPDTAWINCQDSCFLLVPDYVPSNGTEDYDVVDIAFDPPVAPGWGNVVEWEGIGEYSGPISLPFGFRFAGEDRYVLKVSRNGFVTFDLGMSSGMNYPIGPELLPHASIMAPHTYLAEGTGFVRVATLGQPPLRRFVISWEEAPLAGVNCPSALTAQVVLYESTHQIEIHVADFQTCGSIQASLGMTNDGGDFWGNAEYALGSFELSEQAFLFEPNGPNQAEILYFSNGEVFAEGDSLIICGDDADNIAVGVAYPELAWPANGVDCGYQLDGYCLTDLGYSFALDPGESQSLSVVLDGALVGFDVDNQWLSNGASWPGDMSFSLCAPDGSCAVIEGYNISLPGTIVGDFPSDWNTSLTGSYTSCFGLSPEFGGAGVWTLNFLNGWGGSNTDVSFTGSVTLYTICPTQPPSYPDGVAAYEPMFIIEGVPLGPECPSDDNGNGICDAVEPEYCSDGTLWNPNTGQCVFGNPCPGDLNHDGAVTVSDLLLFLPSMSTGCPSVESLLEDCYCDVPEFSDPLCAEHCLLLQGVPDCDLGLIELCGAGTVWSEAEGVCIPYATCPQDFNGDGEVSVSDLLVLLANFQVVCVE